MLRRLLAKVTKVVVSLGRCNGTGTVNSQATFHNLTGRQQGNQQQYLSVFVDTERHISRFRISTARLEYICYIHKRLPFYIVRSMLSAKITTTSSPPHLPPPSKPPTAARNAH